MNTQDYWGIQIGDGVATSPIAFDFWPTAGQTSLTTVARFLAKAIDDYPTLSAVAVNNTITITRQNGGAVSTVTLAHALAHGRVPVKTTDYRQRYDGVGRCGLEKPISACRDWVWLPARRFDGTSFGGVLIENIENMDIRLGFDGVGDSKADNFNLKSTVAGSTTLVLGGGDDVANVESG